MGIVRIVAVRYSAMGVPNQRRCTCNLCERMLHSPHISGDWYNTAYSHKSPMRDVFSDKQWAMFELMYEGYPHRGTSIQYRLSKWYKRFGRSRKIMEMFETKMFPSVRLYLTCQSIINGRGSLSFDNFDFTTPIPRDILALDGLTPESWGNILKNHGLCKVARKKPLMEKIRNLLQPSSPDASVFGLDEIASVDDLLERYTIEEEV